MTTPTRPFASAHAAQTDESASASLREISPQRQPADAPRRLLLQAAMTLPMLGWLGCSAYATPSAAATRAQAPWPLFFTDLERDFVEAATERLIPDGDDGLGARSAAVAFFIDSQLAGPFGKGETWYMQGPWASGSKQQGYQSKLAPAGIYRSAIAQIEAHCRGRFSGKTFAQLGAADQDQVLHGIEKGEIEIKLPEASGKDFFALLWQNTKEGFLSDPMYGGNRNFVGWRLVGFPGPRYNYVDQIADYGKPYKMPYVGLLGRDGLLIQGA